MFKFAESNVFFVPDPDAAAAWYADILGGHVCHENERFAFVQAPNLTLGFHPADAKCPGGLGGSVVYWEVDDIDAAVEQLVARGARLHRGPGHTDFGAGAALLIDPFGCGIGLNQSTPASRAAIAAAFHSVPS